MKAADSSLRRSCDSRAPMMKEVQRISGNEGEDREEEVEANGGGGYEERE